MQKLQIRQNDKLKRLSSWYPGHVLASIQEARCYSTLDVHESVQNRRYRRYQGEFMCILATNHWVDGHNWPVSSSNTNQCAARLRQPLDNKMNLNSETFMSDAIDSRFVRRNDICCAHGSTIHIDVCVCHPTIECQCAPQLHKNNQNMRMHPIRDC